MPPILLAHGDQDEVIPVDALFLSAEALAAADVPAEWHLSAGIGHGIDDGALHHAGQFLAAGFRRDGGARLTTRLLQRRRGAGPQQGAVARERDQVEALGDQLAGARPDRE